MKLVTFRLTQGECEAILSSMLETIRVLESGGIRADAHRRITDVIAGKIREIQGFSKASEVIEFDTNGNEKKR